MAPLLCLEELLFYIIYLCIINVMLLLPHIKHLQNIFQHFIFQTYIYYISVDVVLF